MGLITVDIRNRRPIYEQLTEKIEQLVIAGILKENDQLPSVRSLASELTVNPNTIQKAYNELEHSGIISSLPGRGSFITGNIARITEEKKADLLKEFSLLAKKVLNAGISGEELSEIIKHIRETEEQNHA